MITRRLALGTVLGVLGCRREPRVLLPAAFDGWKLEGAEPAEASPEARRLGVRRVVKGRYAGDGKGFLFSLTVYEMGAGAAAFELVQKSQARSGYLAFQAGNLFCEIASREAVDARALGKVASALERVLQHY